VQRQAPPEQSDEDCRVRVGVDLVAVERVARLLREQPQALDELFTPTEQAYCAGKRRRFEHLAARFAAKEAVLKAFGTGVGQRMRWTDVEIVNNPLGRPRVRLNGAVAARARERGVREVDVSLSHTADLAIAQAVAVLAGRPERPSAGHNLGDETEDVCALPPD
jgi:holo-[acyl-carrier protein] synthase